MYDDINVEPPKETGKQQPVIESKALVANFSLAFTDLKSHQEEDEFLQSIIKEVQLNATSKEYELHKRVLFYKQSKKLSRRILVPSKLTNMIFQY